MLALKIEAMLITSQGMLTATRKRQGTDSSLELPGENEALLTPGLGLKDIDLRCQASRTINVLL